MANSKISALTSATTPLAGTEVLPVVQSSATTQVTVANLTAGRAVSGLSFSAATFGAPASTTLSLQANATTYATILGAGTNNGFVGFGNTNPQYLIDARGTVRSYGLLTTLLTLPLGISATGSTTGGTLPPSTTYYFKIVAVDGIGGVSLPSAESTVVTTSAGSTDSIAVAWTALTGARTYQIWYSTTTGTEANYFTSTTNSFTFTTTTGNTAGTIPAVNTSGSLGVGIANPYAYGKAVVAGATPSAGLETWIQNTTDTGGDNTRYAGLSFSVGSDYSTASIRVFRTNSASDYQNAMVFYTKGTGANPTIPTERLRIASLGDITYTGGNLIPATAAKGINFTANTPAAGMTSQLLNWYEDGTFTPNQGAGLTLVGAFSSTGKYTRIGRQVSVSGTVTGATSVAVTAAGVITSNLPFTVGTAGHGDATNVAINASAAVICTGTSVTAASAIAATATITFSATYFV
ncbi:hypothetical protein UFOVP907_22 [uncultured Caudovirales phage]|uniref:Uncharacterized protein n=1 Tax=uncultured Caudovirales phage TaxID=2100421 RepID=A0A6J5PQK8_9CAUD|nr:hypothetical protein UFOVP907_22 [uncultured Caudovirales phage]